MSYFNKRRSRRSKKDNLDFTNKNKIPSIIKKCIDSIVGKSPYNSIKTKEGKGKERTTITTYELDLTQDIHAYHKELYLYRIDREKTITKAIKDFNKKIDMKNIISIFKRKGI